jgi:hypothetical protein
MRILFLLILAHLTTWLSAQTIHPSSATPSLNQTCNFIVPAGNTTIALEKLEIATHLYFSYNPEILPKIVSADTWVDISLAQGLVKMLGKNYVFRLKRNHLVIRAIEEGKIANGTKEIDPAGQVIDKTTDELIGFDSLGDTSSLQILATKSGEYFNKTSTDTLPNSKDIDEPQLKLIYQIVSPFVKIETLLNKDVISLRSGNRWNIIPNKVIPAVHNHCLLPAMGWNQYDRLMLGLAFFNTRKPEPKWRYTLVPMYSFGRKAVSGIYDVSYNKKVGDQFKSLRVGISALTFRFDKTNKTSTSPIEPLYHAFKPYVMMELSSPKRGNIFSSFVEITGLIASQSNSILNGIHDYYFGYRLNYIAFKQGPSTSLEFKTGFESVHFYNPWMNNTVGRFQTEAKYTWNYISVIKKQRTIEVRGFLGTSFNISSARSPGLFGPMQIMLSGASGNQDVFCDQYFIGRSAGASSYNNALAGPYDYTTGGQQRMDNMGGMGTATFVGSSGMLGSVNVSVGLPKVPSIIRLFFDGALQASQQIQYSNFAPMRFGSSFYDAGIMLRTGILKISLPLLMNENLAKSLGTIDRTSPIPEFVMPTYKQQLQRGIRFSLNIPLNSGLMLQPLSK